MKVIGQEPIKLTTPKYQKYVTTCSKCGAVISFQENETYDCGREAIDPGEEWIDCPRCSNAIRVTEAYTTFIHKKKKYRLCKSIRAVSDYELYQLEKGFRD